MVRYRCSFQDNCKDNKRKKKKKALRKYTYDLKVYHKLENINDKTDKRQRRGVCLMLPALRVLFLACCTSIHSAITLFVHQTPKCKSTVVLLHECVGVWLVVSISISMNPISTPYISILRCRKSKEFRLYGEAKALHQLNFSQPTIMWLNITQLLSNVASALRGKHSF